MLWLAWLRRSIRRKDVPSDCAPFAIPLVVTASRYEMRLWLWKRTGCSDFFPTDIDPYFTRFVFAPCQSVLDPLLEFRERFSYVHVGVG